MRADHLISLSRFILSADYNLGFYMGSVESNYNCPCSDDWSFSYVETFTDLDAVLKFIAEEPDSRRLRSVVWYNPENIDPWQIIPVENVYSRHHVEYIKLGEMKIFRDSGNGQIDWFDLI